MIDVTDSTTLNLLAVVTGNNNLTKIGAGTPIYGGNSQNASTATISVNEGTLRRTRPPETGPHRGSRALTVNDLGTSIRSAGRR